MHKRKLLVVQNVGIFTLFAAVEAAGFVTGACASDAGTELGVGGSSGAAGSSAGAPGAGMMGMGGTPVTPSGGAAGMHVGGAGGGGTSSSGGGGAGGSGGTGGVSAGGAGSGGAGGSSAGSGGTGGVPPKPSICDGAATRVLTMTDTKIDDFEAPMISPAWSSFNDVMPTPNAFSITQATGGGAVMTAKYGHYQGTGAKSLPKMGYGVGTVFNNAIDKGQGKYCIDISAFDGVSFWAKAAKDMAYVELNFVIPETNATKDGGDCLAGCYNHPRKAVTLSTDWKQYSVTFASAGSGSAWVKTRIQELAWTAPVDADWDFSIDEIAFYKGTPPTGPVGTK